MKTIYLLPVILIFLLTGCGLKENYSFGDYVQHGGYIGLLNKEKRDKEAKEAEELRIYKVKDIEREYAKEAIEERYNTKIKKHSESHAHDRNIFTVVYHGIDKEIIIQIECNYNKPVCLEKTLEKF